MMVKDRKKCRCICIKMFLCFKEIKSLENPYTVYKKIMNCHLESCVPLYRVAKSRGRRQDGRDLGAARQSRSD